jgi:cobalt-zinc-cadmium resistance protein CzcA
VIKRLSEFALDQPFFLILLLALFVAGGIAAFRSLSVEAFPDVTDTQVQVISLFPGRAGERLKSRLRSQSKSD